MPKLNEDDLAKLVDDGEIVGFTLDTTEFHHLGYNYETKSLRALKQFGGTAIKVGFSEVVLNEVHAHVRDDLKAKADQARSVLRQFIKAAHLAHDLDQVVAGLGIAAEPGNRSKELLDSFVASIDAERVSVDGGATIRKLHDLYFASQPPFSTKADKKSEFPDAIALLSLEHWAEQRGGHVLAVSADGDWARFAEKSDHLICVPQLAAALNLFNRDDAVVAARLAANLANGTAEQLRACIEREIESTIEIFDVEANAPYFYDVDDQYAEAGGWSIENERFDVIASDDDSVTLAFTVSVQATFHASFAFSVRDGIDKDYVPIGGAQAEKPEEFDLPIVVTVSRDDDDPDPDIIEIESEGRTPTVDFDYVEVDYGDEAEDW